VAAVVKGEANMDDKLLERILNELTELNATLTSMAHDVSAIEDWVSRLAIQLAPKEDHDYDAGPS
jgi:hypothetical protein